MKQLTVQKRSNMNKVLRSVFGVFLLAVMFVSSTGMAAAAPLVVSLRPSGNTYATKPTYSWKRVATAATYRFQVYDIAAAALKINTTIPSSACSAVTNRCSTQPTTVLTVNKSYKWRVAAGAGAFNAWRTFVVLAGFNSQFNANSNGWVSRPGGAWSISAGTTLRTTGMAGKWSSISYNKNFDNFTLTAVMKRVSTTGGASGVWVRGDAVFDAGYNAVENAYLFLYSQNGCFSVWEHNADVFTAKKNWTLSASIVKNGWNTLKVTADMGQLYFYINNVLVWHGTDTSFTTGQVGLTMFRSTYEKLDVDWATLGMSQLYNAAGTAAADEPLEKGQVEIGPNASQPYGPEQAPLVP
jgi:hypothetical protein